MLSLGKMVIRPQYGHVVVLTLSVLAAAIGGSGCGKNLSSICDGSRSAKWDSLGLTADGGARVCKSSDEQLIIRHSGESTTGVFNGYLQTLDKQGWTFYGGRPKDERGKHSIIRDGKMVLFSVDDCQLSVLESATEKTPCSEARFFDSQKK